MFRCIHVLNIFQQFDSDRGRFRVFDLLKTTRPNMAGHKFEFEYEAWRQRALVHVQTSIRLWQNHEIAPPVCLRMHALFRIGPAKISPKLKEFLQKLCTDWSTVRIRKRVRCFEKKFDVLYMRWIGQQEIVIFHAYEKIISFRWTRSNSFPVLCFSFCAFSGKNSFCWLFERFDEYIHIFYFVLNNNIYKYK